MNRIDLRHVGTNLFAALLLFVGGATALTLLDHAFAGLTLLIIGLVFLMLACLPPTPPERE